VVERVPCVDEVWCLTAVLVAEKSRLGTLDIRCTGGIHFAPDCIDHRRGDIDGDDALADGCRGDSEGARASAEVDERALCIEAARPKSIEVRAGIEASLPVVGSDIRRIEMLRASKGNLPRQVSRHIQRALGRVLSERGFSSTVFLA
jgi:hypothetical protein